jgi:NAD(P)-dependent dehydrogenase (short-subunit alcohol dehydrogenase family)
VDIAGSVALVTGANGGIGRAFVAGLLKGGEGRLVPLRLDVIDFVQRVGRIGAEGVIRLTSYEL